MSAFTKYPRGWCEHCGRRALVAELEGVLVLKATRLDPPEYEGWCERCVDPEAAERDAEERSWRGIDPEARARYG